MALLRGLLIVLGAAALLPAVVAALGGWYSGALSAAFIGAGALLFGTWAWGGPTAAFPVRQWVCLGLLAAGFAVLGEPLFAVGALAVILVLQVAVSRQTMRGLRHVEFEQVGPDAVMPEAEPLVAEFEALGFRRVGGVRWRVPVHRKLVTSTLLAAPEADCYAVVTDRVWEVGSLFGDRSLTTSSSGLTPLPPDSLRQTIVRGRPAELVAAHRAAVEVLGARGLEPHRFTADAEILDAAQALDERAIRFITSATVRKLLVVETKGKAREPLLGEDERSRSRIEAWLNAPSLAAADA